MKLILTLIAVVTLSGCQTMQRLEAKIAEGNAWRHGHINSIRSSSHIYQLPNAQYTVRTLGNTTQVYRSGK